jgi:hypothetical protein
VALNRPNTHGNLLGAYTPERYARENESPATKRRNGKNAHMFVKRTRSARRRNARRQAMAAVLAPGAAPAKHNGGGTTHHERATLSTSSGSCSKDETKVVYAAVREISAETMSSRYALAVRCLKTRR